MNKLLAALLIFILTAANVSATEWSNDLRQLFLDNNAIIYEINIRTFNAKDTNANGIIDFDLGEESGSFINAIDRLDEIQTLGINTLHVLPITQTGKTKALGTAGSLYAAVSFNKLNEQLKAKNSILSLNEEAKLFIDEAHKRGIHIIIDVPACGAYDLYLQRPDLFIKDSSQIPVIPDDWTDVRVLNTGDEDRLNTDVFGIYKEFVDLVIDKLGADGIRADVAHSKPAKFWKELIEYSRTKDPEFLWLAESSDSWKDAVSPYCVYTPYDKLLEAGFDGYYGSFFNLKDWKNGKDLTNHVLFNRNLQIKDCKSVIGSFTTHDELSPILINGTQYSIMIIWLNSTLPVNAYYVDGFPTGDDYIYQWANQKTNKSFTDDDYYFAHRGKIDIFNFSRKPGGKNQLLEEEFAAANNLRKTIAPILKSGKFTPLNTNNASVFAYTMTLNEKSVLVFGNLNFDKEEQVTIKIPDLTQKNEIKPVKIDSIPAIENSKINVTLKSGEIEVLLLENKTVMKKKGGVRKSLKR